MTAIQYAENLQIGTLCSASSRTRPGRVTRSHPAAVGGPSREMLCSIVDHILDPEIKYIMTFGGRNGESGFCDRFYLFDTENYTWSRAKTYCPDFGILGGVDAFVAAGIYDSFVVVSGERVVNLNAMKLISDIPQSVGTFATIAKLDGMTNLKYVSLVAVPFENRLLLMGVDIGGDRTAVASPHTNKWDIWEIPAEHKITHGARCTVISHECILITGGWDTEWDHPMSKCTIYNARTHKFTATAGMKRTRSWHAACLMLNGDVFVCGGMRTDDDDYYVADGGGPHPLYPFAEIFNHQTHTWSDVTCTLRPRTGHSCIPISETKILILGGTVSYHIHSERDGCEVYDLVANTRTVTAEMPDHIRNFSVMPLSDLPPPKSTQHDVD
jgi:hypothetical protein